MADRPEAAEGIIGQERKPAGEVRAKLYSLELGRFIAAFLVLLCHAGLYLGVHTAVTARPLFWGAVFPGQLGVQYFFVLSGFVMASAHHGDFGHIAAIPKFWWRRICRIYPAYWLALCIPLYYLHASLKLGSAAALLLLDPWHSTEFIPAAWSLRFELAFYIMFGLCMLPYIGKPLLAYWVVLTYWRWNQIPLLAVHTPLLLGPNLFAIRYAYNFVNFYELYFFGGLAAGYAYVKCRFGWRVWAGLLAAGALLLCAMVPMEGWGTQYGSGGTFTTLFSCALGAFILGLAGLERLGVFRLGRLAGWLGMVSYPLYVLHMPLMLLTDNALHWGLFAGWALYAHFILLTGGTLLLSALVTVLFDQPVQRGLRRLTRRIFPAPAAAPLCTEAG